MGYSVLGATLSSNYFFWWLAQALAVAILVWLFLRWRPGFLGGRTISQSLGQALDAREEQIRHQLEAAERSRQEAARIRAGAEADIVRAREEAAGIVERASSTSEAIQHEMQERAQEEYQRIVGQARVQIDYERQQAELALRRRAADIVVDASRQVIERNHDASSDQRLIDEALGRVERLQ